MSDFEERLKASFREGLKNAAASTYSNADSSKVPSAAEIMRNMEETLKLVNAPCYICDAITQTPRGTGKLAICALCRKQWRIDACVAAISLFLDAEHWQRDLATFATMRGRA